MVDDGAGYREAWRTNVLGTKHVLDAFPDARFLYVSSASVYDPQNREFLITEESSAGTHLQNAYSRTKYEAERLVLESSRPSGALIMRPHVIYGPGDRKIIPRLLRAHRFGRFLVLGNGTNHISVTHIDNLSDALLLAATATFPVVPQVVNIVDAEPVRIETLLAHVKSVHGISVKNLYIGTVLPYIAGLALEAVHAILRSKNPPFISRYLTHQMTSDHDISSEKARRLIGYAPIKSFTDYRP
jgi:nucleoside-diphosphate-sugar epimerase